MKWRRQGFPWVVAAAVVAAVLLPIGLTLRLPQSEGASSGGGRLPDLWITTPETAADAVLQERLRLLDPTPLFLPSSLSSSRLDVDLAGREEAGVLRNYEPRLVAEAWGRGGAAPGMTGTAVGPVEEVVAPEPRLPFLGLGRAQTRPESLSKRWAVADIYTARGRARVGRVFLAPTNRGDFPTSLWSPLELMVVIAADGVAATPEVVAGSGLSEVDHYMVDAVRSVLGLGGGLPPGTYRLVVGP